MDDEFYTQILQWYLVPFIGDKFSDGTHRFMQDNDPKLILTPVRHGILTPMEERCRKECELINFARPRLPSMRLLSPVVKPQ